MDNYQFSDSEALNLINKGIKVTHQSFHKEEYLSINSEGLFVRTKVDASSLPERWYMSERYNEGWSVFNPHLRLVVTEKCPNNCEGCCMKNWKYAPAISLDLSDLSYFSEIYITGGEPLEVPTSKMMNFLIKLKKINPSVKLYLYTATAMRDSQIGKFEVLMDIFDGASVTIHSLKDMKAWNRNYLGRQEFKGKSMRLNVFYELEKEKTFLVDKKLWDVRPKVWLKDCPLPKKEEFGEYILFPEREEFNDFI